MSQTADQFLHFTVEKTTPEEKREQVSVVGFPPLH